MNPTYSSHGSEEFNNRLHETLLRLASDVESLLGANLVALALGGGYGRGEGAVVRLDGREMPYNDLDLFLVVADKRSVPVDPLNSMAEPYAEELTIHVDFSRPVTIRDIEKWPNWLMWHDLLNGHIVLSGPKDVFTGHAPDELKQPLPAIEATKLLLNRGAGLLWAMRVARNVEESPDRDFVVRNYQKCALALGDALLIGHRRYTTAYGGRDVRFAQLEREDPEVASLDLGSLYEKALEFKFCPDGPDFTSVSAEDLEMLADLWGAVFLHSEELRTGSNWAAMDEYVRWDGIREPEQHTAAKLLRNLALNLRLGRASLRYPREMLYRQIPALLGLTGAPVTAWAIESEKFLKVWDRFN